MEPSVIYVFHGRLPDPRAAAIFAVQEAKSLVAHVPVTMVVPNRNTTDLDKARALYQLPEHIQLIALPIVEFSQVPFLKRFAFGFSLISFSFRLERYFRHSSASWVITTDHLPALVASWCGKKVLIEVHDFPSLLNPIWRLLLRRADIVLSTNTWKRNELMRRFKVPSERIFVERNGIDLERFAPHDKMDARRTLGLPPNASIALYTGNLYSWKGVDTLVDAATLMPDVLIYIVGGSDADRTQLMKRAKNSSNVHFIARVPHHDIPLWQSAADVLVLPNTAKEEISAHYTSPMKLFEYMASGRPIVASDLPSIREILPENAGFFVKPDSPKSLADAIKKVLNDNEEARNRALRARELASEYSWEKRAERLFAKIVR